MNALTTTEHRKLYGAALMRAASVIPANEGKPFLQLKNGEWVYGENATPLDPKAVLLVNPFTIRHGYVAFSKASNGLAELEDGNLAEESWPMSEPLPYPEEMPKLKHEPRAKNGTQPTWQQQVILEMKIVEGGGEGTELVYKAATVGGLSLARKLVEEIARKLTLDAGASFVPAIELQVDSYLNKSYNREVYTPKFEILAWDPDYSGGDGEVRESEPVEMPLKIAAPREEPAEGDEGSRRGRGRPKGSTNRAKPVEAAPVEPVAATLPDVPPTYAEPEQPSVVARSVAPTDLIAAKPAADAIGHTGAGSGYRNRGPRGRADRAA